MFWGIQESGALGTAFAILYIPFELILFFIFVFIGSSGTNTPNIGPDLLGAFVIAFNLTIFVFLDRTILAAREMDFFHRDTLWYGTLRKIIWPLSTVGMFGAILTQTTNPAYSVFAILWPGP